MNEKTDDFDCPSCHGSVATIGHYADGKPSVCCVKCNRRMDSRPIEDEDAELDALDDDEYEARMEARINRAVAAVGRGFGGAVESHGYKFEGVREKTERQ